MKTVNIVFILQLFSEVWCDDAANICQCARCPSKLLPLIRFHLWIIDDFAPPPPLSASPLLSHALSQWWRRTLKVKQCDFACISAEHVQTEWWGGAERRMKNIICMQEWGQSSEDWYILEENNKELSSKGAKILSGFISESSHGPEWHDRRCVDNMKTWAFQVSDAAWNVKTDWTIC